MDTTTLEGAYRDLLTAARDGGFRAPADQGAWTAEQVLAHVVATDRLLIGVTAELLAGGSPTYDNAVATRTPYLDALGRAAGGWDALVATVRATGLELVYLARELHDSAAATPVPTRIVDGDTVRVEAPMPWSGVLNTHAEVHLPEHRAQLDGLRG